MTHETQATTPEQVMIELDQLEADIMFNSLYNSEDDNLQGIAEDIDEQLDPMVGSIDVVVARGVAELIVDHLNDGDDPEEHRVAELIEVQIGQQVTS